MGSSVNWTQQRKNQWAWRYINRRFPKNVNKKIIKKKKEEQNIHEPWDNHKRCNICVMRIPGGEETEEISENVPKLTTDTKTQI